MSQENERAAQRAHENARRPPDDYDDEGRPAAARARDTDRAGRPAPRTESTEADSSDEDI